MAYELKFTDSVNKGSIIVEDRTLDVINTSLKFPGRGNTGFGQAVNENFLHLLENFANTQAPLRPVEGQLWYDTTPGINQLKIFDGTSWVASGGLKKSDFEPSQSTSLAGDLWVNTDRQQLFLYTGASWILVGPSFSEGLLTGTESETIIGTDDNEYNVLSIKLNNKIAAIITDNEFVPKSAIPGFRQGLKPGINLSDKPLVDNKTLKFQGISEKAENLIVDNNTIPARNFLRRDTISTTDFQFRIRSNQGLEIGSGGQLKLSIDRESATIQHNTSGSNINFRLRDNNVTQTVLTIDSSSKIGINNPSPDSELDVRGNITVSPLLTDSTTGKVIINNVDDDSIKTNGGIEVAKNLQISGETFLEDTLTSTNIVPDLNRTRNIGSTTNRYNQIISDTFIGNLQGNVTGNITGRSGSSDRLTSATTFSIDGDVEFDSFSFDGQVGGSTKSFDVRIRNSFISNKDTISDSSPLDEILINRTTGQTGVFKISKQNFLKTIPLVPVGSVLQYAGAEPPRGWLFCDGSEIRKSDFTELWLVIGHRFRDPSLISDGGTNFFALPDIRGRFPLGLDNMGGAPANRVTSNAARDIGGNSGSESVQLSLNNVPNHDHSLRAPSGTQYYGIRVGTGAPADPEAINLPMESGQGGTQGLASSGGINTSSDLGRPFNVMNPYLAMNYIIYTGTQL